MYKKILITGGAGFIGSNLALSLTQRGHSVVVFDNLHHQIHGKYPDDSYSYKKIKNVMPFIKGDVTKIDEIKHALNNIDTVVHLAAETGTGQSMYAIRQYVDVNIGATALLLDLIVNLKLPIKRLIVASSRAIYGEGKYLCTTHGLFFPSAREESKLASGIFEHSCPICGVDLKPLPTDEDAALSPSSIYGVTKLSQEQLILTTAKSLGISGIALRYQNVYGPGQSLLNPYTGILSIFSTAMAAGLPINIFEDGCESRDFVYIDDVVRATISTVENSEVVVGAYNVGTGMQIKVRDVANILRSKLSSSSKVEVTGQYRLGDIRHNFADLTKFTNEFGFTPVTSIESGIESFVKWVKSQPYLESKYEKSLMELGEKGMLK